MKVFFNSLKFCFAWTVARTFVHFKVDNVFVKVVNASGIGILKTQLCNKHTQMHYKLYNTHCVTQKTTLYGVI